MHPLNTVWTLWFDYSEKKTVKWEDNLKPLSDVDTVEAWWAAYDRLPKLDTMRKGSNLSLFRKGVRPVFMDEVHAKGGQYKVQKFTRDSFDAVWLRSTLFCIGEVSVEDSQHVFGTIASYNEHGDLKLCEVSLWIDTNEKDEEELVKRLGRFYKKQIGLGELKTRLPFRPHNKENK